MNTNFQSHRISAARFSLNQQVASLVMFVCIWLACGCATQHSRRDALSRIPLFSVQALPEDARQAFAEFKAAPRNNRQKEGYKLVGLLPSTNFVHWDVYLEGLPARLYRDKLIELLGKPDRVKWSYGSCAFTYDLGPMDEEEAPGIRQWLTVQLHDGLVYYAWAGAVGRDTN
jgi:hypothetical protein